VKTVGIRAQLEPVCFDGFALDPARRQLIRDGELYLQPKAFDLLALLEDLGSKNGTKIGDRRVVGQCSLRDDDVISVGTTRLLYRTAAAVGSTETVGPSAR
jgi:pSer/pThr/pTyr-binding forkhead associated (FHA) protein